MHILNARRSNLFLLHVYTTKPSIYTFHCSAWGDTTIHQMIEACIYANVVYILCCIVRAPVQHMVYIMLHSAMHMFYVHNCLFRLQKPNCGETQAS